jgi:hypothetical protein
MGHSFSKLTQEDILYATASLRNYLHDKLLKLSLDNKLTIWIRFNDMSEDMDGINIVYPLQYYDDNSYSDKLDSRLIQFHNRLHKTEYEGGYHCTSWFGSYTQILVSWLLTKHEVLVNPQSLLPPGYSCAIANNTLFIIKEKEN